MANNEKISKEEMKEMKKIQEKMDNLIKGGYVENGTDKLPFKKEK